MNHVFGEAETMPMIEFFIFVIIVMNEDGKGDAIEEVMDTAEASVEDDMLVNRRVEGYDLIEELL